MKSQYGRTKLVRSRRKQYRSLNCSNQKVTNQIESQKFKRQFMKQREQYEYLQVDQRRSIGKKMKRSMLQIEETVCIYIYIYISKKLNPLEPPCENISTSLKNQQWNILQVSLFFTPYSLPFAKHWWKQHLPPTTVELAFANNGIFWSKPISQVHGFLR